MRSFLLKYNELSKEGYFTYLCALLSRAILPLHVKYLPPVMILWTIFWYIENYYKTADIYKTKALYKYLFLSFMIYYFWQVVGLFYSSDLEMGISNLFGRLSLVIFPLVLLLPGEMIKKRLNFLFKVFAVSTMAYLTFCYGYALYRSIEIDAGVWYFNPHPKEFWLNYFFGEELLINIHPSYFSLYTLLSLFISLESFFNSGDSKRLKIFWLLGTVFLVMSVYFLSSRAGLIAGLFMIPLYLIIKFQRLKKNRYSWIFVILAMLITIPVILKNQRMDYFFGKLLNTKVEYERKDDPRLTIWKSSLQLIRDNLLLGVGIGDVRTELTNQYLKVGEYKMAQERLNAHNQFLEVSIENGIIGLLIFLSILSLILIISLADKNILLLAFLISALVFFIFETVLYRLAGVTFFSLFSFLLLHINNVGTKTDR